MLKKRLFQYFVYKITIITNLVTEDSDLLFTVIDNNFNSGNSLRGVVSGRYYFSF